MGSVSSETWLKYGVPQGSVIGPQAFTLYFHVIGQIIRQHSVLYHIYADDVQLFLIFNPAIPWDAACALFQLTRMTFRSGWLNNKLTMNPDMNSSLLLLIITMNAFNICLFVVTLKYFLLLLLGTWVLSLITRWRWMTMLINFRALWTFISATWTELGGFLILMPFDACRNAVRILILSKLDYCSCLLNGLTQKAAEIHHSPPKDYTSSLLSA